MTDSRNVLIPKNILLVEDDLDLSKLFTTYIHSNDFNVTAVFNGNDVEPAVDHQTFDLIFLDINLPGKDGFEVLKFLKSNEKTKDIPVIMLTNHGELDYMERGLALGAADYAIKMNVNLEEVKRLAQKHIIDFDARVNTEKK